VKALSGRQPFWYWLFRGKSIENRFERSSAHRQLKSYREPFLLHASAGVGTQWEFSDACEFIRDTVTDEVAWADFRDTHLDIHLIDGEPQLLPRRSLLRGGIVGRARVVGLITPDGNPWGLEGREAVERFRPDMRWHMRGQWGHILADVEPLPFVPYKGALVLFEVPESALRAVA
jgi:hypothetical protein